jgi:uncharacterized protein (TIGR00255 family)
MPPDLDQYEPAIRGVLKSHMNRGHLQVQVLVSRTNGPAATLNRELLRNWVESFRAAAVELGLDAKPDLNVAFRLPGIMQGSSNGPNLDNLEPLLVEAATEAAQQLNGFRDQEGAAIAKELHERRKQIELLAGKMEKIRAKAVHAFQKRLNERLGELLSGASIDPQRIAHEAAILAERSDISEELLRLKTHAVQLASLIDSSGEKGKKLDFLLQEMNREANTILSKTGGLGDLGLTITDLALAAKAEIDKIREQSLNLE